MNSRSVEPSFYYVLALFLLSLPKVGTYLGSLLSRGVRSAELYTVHCLRYTSYVLLSSSIWLPGNYWEELNNNNNKEVRTLKYAGLQIDTLARLFG